MKISPLKTKLQSQVTFGDTTTIDPKKPENEEPKASEESKKLSTKQKVFAATAGALMIGGAATGIALGTRGCSKSQEIVPGADYIPSAYVAHLDFNNSYKEYVLKPKAETIDFSKSETLAAYRDKGLTLKNIIETEYYGGEYNPRHDTYYKKIVSEFDQANPGVMDNVFNAVSSGKYEKWQDVPFDELINTNIDDALKNAGLRFADMNIFSVNTPKVSFEFYTGDETDCAACKAQEDVIHYSPKNEVVLVDSSIKDSSSKESKTVQDAITKNYNVEAGSYEYYFILNMLANNRLNEGLFKDYEGKVNDSNRAELLEKRGGSFYLHMLDDIELDVHGGRAGVAEKKDAEGAKDYYSNLLPEVNKVNIPENNIKTIEDLTKFYKNPVTGEALEDIDEYDAVHEAYREAIMKTIINDYPQLFEGLSYEEALELDISKANSIELPYVVINFNGANVCDHTEQEKTEAPTEKPTKPAKKNDPTDPAKKPDPTNPEKKPDPKPTEPKKPDPKPTDPPKCDPEPEIPVDTDPQYDDEPSVTPGGGPIGIEPNDPVTKPKKQDPAPAPDPAPAVPETPAGGNDCDDLPDLDSDWS